MKVRLDPLIRWLAANSAFDRPADLVAALGGGALRDLAERAQQLVGNPLHPALTDLPIGFFTSAWTLDLLPGRAATAVAARRLIALGLLSTAPAILSGLGDAANLKRPERRLATAHAGLNVGATAAFALSWGLRRRRPTTTAMAAAHVGAALATAAAAIGGRLALAPVDARAGDWASTRAHNV